MRSVPGAERLFFIAALALPLFAIWAVAFPPLLDFPEHALIAQVVARGFYDAGPDFHGTLSTHSLLAPYGMFYFLAAPLVRLFTAVIATKILLSLAVLGTAFALRWLLRVLGRDPYAFYFAFPFLFSTLYTAAGLVPYIAGIPLLMVLVTLVLRQPNTTARNFLPRLGLALALVWAHPMIYAAAAPAAAAIVLVLHRRSFRQIGFAALWLGLPALYLAAWTPALVAETGVSWAFKGIHLLSFFENLGAYDTPALSRAFLLPKLPLLLWIAVAAWRRERWSGQQQALAAAVGVLLLLVLALPEFYGAHQVAASFRFTPIAALLAAGILATSACRPRLPRALLLTWCLGALSAHAVLAWRFDRQMNGFVTLARQMEPRQTVVQLFEGPENSIFAHALTYYLMAKGGISPQPLLAITWSGIFPAHLLPPFPWGDVRWESNDPLSHPAGRVFRYIVVKTSRSESDPLPEPPPAFHKLVTRSGGWLLYERR